jgi:hypothetical protein
MGKWSDKLIDGTPADFDEVWNHSGDLLRELLPESDDKDGSKTALAERLGVDLSVVSNILAGNRKLARKRLITLREELVKERAKKKVEPVAVEYPAVEMPPLP